MTGHPNRLCGGQIVSIDFPISIRVEQHGTLSEDLLIIGHGLADIDIAIPLGTLARAIAENGYRVSIEKLPVLAGTVRVKP